MLYNLRSKLRENAKKQLVENKQTKAKADAKRFGGKYMEQDGADNERD